MAASFFFSFYVSPSFILSCFNRIMKHFVIAQQHGNTLCDIWMGCELHSFVNQISNVITSWVKCLFIYGLSCELSIALITKQRSRRNNADVEKMFNLHLNLITLYLLLHADRSSIQIGAMIYSDWTLFRVLKSKIQCWCLLLW